MTKPQVNAINYTVPKNRESGVWRTTIPPFMIPKSLMELILKQSKVLLDYKTKLEDEGLTTKEIKVKLRKFREDEGLRKLFGLFLNIKPNLILLSFALSEKVSDINKEEVLVPLIKNILNDASRHFGKGDIDVVPLSPKSVSKKLDIQIGGCSEEVNFLRGINRKLITILALTFFDFQKFEDSDNNNKLYNKFLKLNEKETTYFEELNEAIQEDPDIMEYIEFLLDKGVVEL